MCAFSYHGRPQEFFQGAEQNILGAKFELDGTGITKVLKTKIELPRVSILSFKSFKVFLTVFITISG